MVKNASLIALAASVLLAEHGALGSHGSLDMHHHSQALLNRFAPVELQDLEHIYVPTKQAEQETIVSRLLSSVRMLMGAKRKPDTWM
jgi:hypothetical protein